jgi:RNA polymerase sigma-70 factor (ECF subfamily)
MNTNEYPTPAATLAQPKSLSPVPTIQEPRAPTYDDPEFLRSLIEEHSPRLLRKAIAMCGDADQADDLVQATWVQAHFKRTTYRGRGTFSAWIDTILRHTYINYRRAQRRREQYELDSYTDPSVERELAVITSAECSQDTDAQIGHLVRAILTLAPRERQVFVLRAIVGHSVREVATQLNRAEGTVKATFSHATTRLRKALHAEEEFLLLNSRRVMEASSTDTLSIHEQRGDCVEER